MTIRLKYRPSLEAITYQGRSMLFSELTMAFTTLLENGVATQAALDAARLDKIVFDNTGLKVEFKILVGEVNAYALPPIMDLNSPLLNTLREFGLSKAVVEAHLTHAKVTAYTNDLRGQINRTRGKVSGVFSKVLSTIYVGSGLWTRANLSSAECAAIVLHEVGHLFSFFETLVQTTTTNMVLASAVQDLRETDDPKLRLKLVYETAQALNVELEQPERLAAPDTDPRVFQSIFLKAKMDKSLQSSAGSEVYDLRSAEFLADQFATRHGASRDLVMAMDKMMRVVGYSHRRSTAVHVTVEAIRTAATLVAMAYFPIATFVIFAITLIVSPEQSKAYDDPAERMARVKNDLVQALKNTSLPKSTRDQLLDDIEMVDRIREGVKDHRSFFNVIWTALTSRRRDQHTQMKLQQQLEELVNNSFFVKAAKLQSMS